MSLDRLTEMILTRWSKEMERTRAAETCNAEPIVVKQATAHQASLDRFSDSLKITNLSYRLEIVGTELETARKEKESAIVELVAQRDIAHAEAAAAQERIEALEKVPKEASSWDDKLTREDGPSGGTCACTTPVTHGTMFSWRASGVTNWMTVEALQERKPTKVIPKKRAFVQLPDGRYMFPASTLVLGSGLRVAIKRKLTEMSPQHTPASPLAAYLDYDPDSDPNTDADNDDSEHFADVEFITTTFKELTETKAADDEDPVEILDDV